MNMPATMMDQIAGKNIFVLDSKAAGGKLELIVQLLDRYLTNNPDATFDQAVSYAEQLQASSQVLFSLSSYENLTEKWTHAQSRRSPRQRSFHPHARYCECSGDDQGRSTNAW